MPIIRSTISNCTIKTAYFVACSRFFTFTMSTMHGHMIIKSAFMCFVWIWEQTAIIFLYSINWLGFITEMKCVYCAVRTGSLNIIQVTLMQVSVFHSQYHFTKAQGRIKLFGAPRQWKNFRPLFQAGFLGGGKSNTTPPSQTPRLPVKHHAFQSQDRNNKYLILYIEFCINNKI
jgi:hypothetical protein